MILDKNNQIAWESFEDLENGHTRIFLLKKKFVPNYRVFKNIPFFLYCAKSKTVVMTNLLMHFGLGGNFFRNTYFSINDLIGIKSKCCGERRNSYNFCGGEDILFKNVKWTRQARGAIRCGFNGIRYTKVVVHLYQERLKEKCCISIFLGCIVYYRMW